MKQQKKNNIIQVRTFAGFSAQYEGTEIFEKSRGESQVRMLMILMSHYGKTGIDKSLIKNMLFEAREIEDVSHAIRNVMYNTRKQMKEHGMPDAMYMKQKKGVYYWTGEIELVEDARSFEEDYQNALTEEDRQKQAELFMETAYQYTGRFLEGMETIAWIYQESERYRDMFHAAVENAMDYLREKNRYKDMYDLGAYATKVDPFSEWEVYVLEALSSLGRYADAEKYYDSTVDNYIMEYGNRQNEYVKDIISKLGSHLVYGNDSLESIQSRLHSEEAADGRGYYCSLPVFQELYRTVERTMERAGEKIFLMLCTIVDSKGNPMREGQKLNELSERLKTAIVDSVRHTDTVAKYGQGQYLVLLINTTKENCSIVEKRINSKFIINRQRTSIEYAVNGLVIKSQKIDSDPAQLGITLK